MFRICSYNYSSHRNNYVITQFEPPVFKGVGSFQNLLYSGRMRKIHLKMEGDGFKGGVILIRRIVVTHSVLSVN